MNIAIDVRSLLSSCRTGVGEYTYNLVDNLTSHKEHRFFLFSNSRKGAVNIPNLKSKDNVSLVEKKIPNKVFNLSQKLFKYPQLDKVIEQEVSVDLDIFFSPNINFTSLSNQVKHILTIHDLSFIYFSDCYSKKQKLWHKTVNPKKKCQKADFIITPSENTTRDLIKEYGIEKNKVKTIYPGINANFLQNKKLLQDETRKEYELPENFILFLGTLEPRKNIKVLFHAYTELSKKLKQKYPLVIAGARGWKYKPILDKIKQEKHVQYIGYVKQKYKKTLFGLSNLFVYPSFYEGFGFPVLEAMSQETPVITSNRSSLSEITDGAAYLIDPHNPQDLKKAMQNLLKNDNLSQKYIQKGVKQVRNFSWDKTAEAFLELVK